MGQYDAISKIGYDYIELIGTLVYAMSDEELSRAARTIHENAVPCLGFCSYCDERLPIVGDGFDAAAVREYARRMCLRGAALGIKNIGVGSPKARILPIGYPEAKANEQAMEFLSITAEEAAPSGIHVLLEPLNRDICNYLLSTQAAVELIKRVNLPNVSLVLDFQHMGVEGESLDIAAAAMPYVGHLHISHIGKHGGEKLFLREEESDLYAAQIKTALSSGYDGTLSIEASITDHFETDAEKSLMILHRAVR